MMGHQHLRDHCDCFAKETKRGSEVNGHDTSLAIKGTHGRYPKINDKAINGHVLWLWLFVQHSEER